MKVGLAVFMVVIFLAQNAKTGVFEANNFAYKKLTANETQYFLSNLNALPEGASSVGGTDVSNSELTSPALNLEVLSAQISAHIKSAVEPLLLQEASIVKSVSPSFDSHQSSINILMYSFIFGILALLVAEKQKLIFKIAQSLKLKDALAGISPRSPNYYN